PTGFPTQTQIPSRRIPPALSSPECCSEFACPPLAAPTSSGQLSAAKLGRVCREGNDPDGVHVSRRSAKARPVSLSHCRGFHRDTERSLQAAMRNGRSQRIASSICPGVHPYSSARSVTDSRALKREAIIAVEIPVPEITGFPNPTKGLISMVFGSFSFGSITNGKNFNLPFGLASTLSRNIL